MENILWRASNAVIFMFFIASSLVQLNDDDAYLWVPIYAIPAVLSASIVLKPFLIYDRLWHKIKTIHSTICIILLAKLTTSLYYIININPKVTPNMDNFFSILEHEEAREFAGVSIVIIWLNIIMRKNDDNNSKFLFTFGFLSLVSIPITLWAICWFDISSPHFQYCKKLCKT